jgi:ATP-dependent helicase/nuclease subunit A
MSALPDRGEPQVRASQPRASVFVAANAGSGKTSTLVKRVARLLLDGARPEAILCVTYTKAAAAEMQRRLFKDLGTWAVAPDADLQEALAAIDEGGRPLSQARALFARALETPGGLKIQTLHAFCEKLLRRFPLEAGVSPGFTLLDEVAAAEVSARAREGVNDAALARPEGLLAAAYAHFSVQLDWISFNAMFAAFEARRAAIAAHLDDCERQGGYANRAWRLCGFGEPTPPEEIEADALAGLRFRLNDWKKAAEALSRSDRVKDQDLGAAMSAVTLASPYADVAAPFFTDSGEPRKQLGTSAVDRRTKAWLIDEQARHVETRRRLAAATVARDTAYALTLASAYAALYEGEKSARGALDFTDLIARAGALLGKGADAAWVLYKLDGGLTHILIDEAQDTAPEQWDIVRALTEEFFVGLGSSPLVRTVFAVGDPKQSIFSFQGARPERLAVETQRFGEIAGAAGAAFEEVKLLDSWRSAPEILRFVDEVFTDREARAGLSPMAGGNVEGLPPVHIARRPAGGCVELWPLEVGLDGEDPDVWAPVDAEPPTSAIKLLAARIARAVTAMVTRGDGVRDRDSGEMRPCTFGDVLILVRRRSALFHEIIRALKKEGAPVAGADRLRLSEHGVFEDLMALGRFARFPGDELALAGLLRGPFCDLDEESLFDLAYERGGRLWPALLRRAAERPEWSAAAGILGWARSEAGHGQPFDFYSRFLGRLDGDGRSMRQRLLTRMGAEGEQALDAFLAQTLEAEARGCREMETFLDAMAASEIEIKREPELAGAGPGEVRVMTVHGAKGLEAPIVILPDTTTRATAQQAGPLLETVGGGYLWAPRKADDCAASASAREARDRAVDQESARLLYVALTRARDRLIICGVQPRMLFERSWYDFVSRAFGEIHTRGFALAGGDEARRYGAPPTPCAPVIETVAAAPPPPAWTRGLAPADGPLARYASPSTLGDGSPVPASSPLAEAGGLGRYRRGELIHRLLQLLPDLAPDRRAEAARRLLARERDLRDDQRAEMVGAALGVLEDPRFAAVFGPGSRAEAAVAGVAERLPAGLAVSGRVDRLLVEAGRVLVVDFKTNRPAPARIEDAADAYITQMALYWALLGEIYPGRAIEAALVWTDGPRLMPVPERLMRDALARLIPAG